MPTYSQPGKLGSHAPSFSLPGVDGKTYTLEDFKNAKALVVAFMCNHCPYVIAIQSRMNRMATKYSELGASWIGINSNDSQKYPDDRFEAMQIRAREQGFEFPYLHDETQEVARAYGAVCTPEFFVYQSVGGQFVLKYQGRMDDSWKNEAAVTQHELADALDLILAGKEPNADQKPAMGCSIKWK